MNAAVRNVLERIILFPVRLRHRRDSRAKQRAREAALASMRHALMQATHFDAGSIKTVLNVGLYVLHLDDDLAQFTDDLICAIGDRRRAFVAKHEAILLYEAGEDMPQLLGKQFRKAVQDLGATETQIARLNSAASELNSFWREEREFLSTIRNALSAHREHDALAYTSTLEQLKPLEVMQRAADLSGRIQQLIPVLMDVALLGSRPGAIVQDMIISRSEGGAG